MTYALFLAQTEPASCLSAMALPVIMIVLMYLLLIRPQQKQMKEQEEFQDSLKIGDEVVTAGGIYGTVARLEEDKVTLEVASRTKIRVVRSQIIQSAASVAEDEDDDSDDDKKES